MQDFNIWGDNGDPVNTSAPGDTPVESLRAYFSRYSYQELSELPPTRQNRVFAITFESDRKAEAMTGNGHLYVAEPTK